MTQKPFYLIFLFAGIFSFSPLLAHALSKTTLSETANPLPQLAIYTESFESGYIPTRDEREDEHIVGVWRSDDDDQGDFFRAAIANAPLPVYEGARSVELTIDGRTDDGTLWLERTIPVNPDKTYSVAIDFWLWSERQSDVNQWYVVAYAGKKDPEVEADLPRISITNLTAGWQNYSSKTHVTSDASGQLYVAFGISCVWETVRTYYVDLVTVSVQEVTKSPKPPPFTE